MGAPLAEVKMVLRLYSMRAGMVEECAPSVDPAPILSTQQEALA